MFCANIYHFVYYMSVFMLLFLILLFVWRKMNFIMYIYVLFMRFFDKSNYDII